MKKLLSIALILSAFNVFSQNGNLKRANNYFQNLSYAAAIPEFEKVLGSEFDSPEMKAKLAYCYLVNEELDKAESMYRGIVASNSSNDISYWFGYTLLKRNKTAEAIQYLMKFANANPSDSRSILIKQDANYLTKLLQNPAYFEVFETTINSDRADFGVYPMPGNTHALIVSSRYKPMFTNQKWGGNNEYFLNYAKTSVGDNGELKRVKRVCRPMNSKRHEGPLCFSADGKTVYFTSNHRAKDKKMGKDGIQHLGIFIADVVDGKWKNIREFSHNSKDFACGHPCLSKDGKQLYFSSDRPGGMGGADIYVCDVLSDGKFGTLQNLGPNVNTSGHELFPWSGSNQLLYFASNGRPGFGGLDIFVTKTNAAHVAKNLGAPINGTADDFAISFSTIEPFGYFSSNRKGSDDIYRMRQIRDIVFEITFNGKTIDQSTKKIIANATVIITDPSGKVVASVQSDVNGDFSALLQPGVKYNFAVSANKYEATQVSLEMPLDQASVQKNIELVNKPDHGIRLLVLNQSTKEPIQDALVIIIDKKTGKELINQRTSNLGDVLKKLPAAKIGDQLDLQIILSANGFLSKEVTYSEKIDRDGIIQLHEKLDLNMSPLTVGGDLAKMLGIKPIYFDLGKFNIRKDAAIELDKIVKVMNEYPTMVIELGSHTDCRSSVKFNQTLSSNRAKASAAYIKQRISNPSRISGKGYGESRLLNDCGCEGTVKSDCSEEQHQLNRRTEFIIIKI